jgi:hypothetical protein
METTIDLVAWSRQQALTLLPALGNRWLHVQGVVKQAEWVRTILVEEDQQYLLAAAYLHDIGYAPALRRTGFHPLDGAMYVLKQLGNTRLAALVAHHSEARFEAALRGYATELHAFPRERSALADALIYCDLTTDGRGKQVTLKERLADILSRYEETNLVVQALHQARPYWSLAVARTQQRLKKHLSLL